MAVGKLHVLLIFQESHPLDVCPDQWFLVLFPKAEALGLQDARAEFAGHVCLAVFVERHQHVHTVDIQFHAHDGDTAGDTLQLRVNHVYIIILGDGVDSAVVVGAVDILHPVGHHQFQLYHSFQQQVFGFLETWSQCLLTPFSLFLHLHQVQFCRDLTGLIDLPLHVDPMQRHDVGTIVARLPDLLLYRQLPSLCAVGHDTVAQGQPIDEEALFCLVVCLVCHMIRLFTYLLKIEPAFEARRFEDIHQHLVGPLHVDIASARFHLLQ